MADIYEGNNELNAQMAPLVVPLTGGITTALIWHEPLTAWESLTTGREIPLNEEIHLAPGWINKSEVNIVGHVDLTIIYPDGTEHALAAVLNQDYEAPPQSGRFVQFEPFTSSQEGTYTVVATLSSVGQVLDSVTFTLVSVPVAAEGLITLYGTGFDVKGIDWNWCAYWNYADGSSGPNMDDYYGWRGPNDACTPAKPIPLNNLSFKIQEGSWQYGYTAKSFGPFVVEDGKSYTINWQTGELVQR